MPATNEALCDHYSSYQSYLGDDPLLLQIPKRGCRRPPIPQRITSLAARILTHTTTYSVQCLITPPGTPPDSDAEDDEAREHWRGPSSNRNPAVSDSPPISPVSPPSLEDCQAFHIQPSLKRLATSPALCEAIDDLTLEFPCHRSLTSEQKRFRKQRRCISAGTRLQHSTQAPDRFIPIRHPDTNTSEIFRSTKPSKDLSKREKILRNPEAANDPFEPPNPANKKQRTDRFFSDEIAKRRAMYPYGFYRISSPSGLLDPFRDASLAPLREPSNGAVWNVGGPVAPAMSRQGPPRGVPNGKGGRTVSGSNAPYYIAAFVDDKPSDHFDKEQQDARVAAALEINVASRILDTGQSPQHGRSAHNSPFGFNSKTLGIESNTKWQNGQWVRVNPRSGSFL